MLVVCHCIWHMDTRIREVNLNNVFKHETECKLWAYTSLRVHNNVSVKFFNNLLVCQNSPTEVDGLSSLLVWKKQRQIILFEAFSIINYRNDQFISASLVWFEHVWFECPLRLVLNFIEFNEVTGFISELHDVSSTLSRNQLTNNLNILLVSCALEGIAQ